MENSLETMLAVPFLKKRSDKATKQSHRRSMQMIKFQNFISVLLKKRVQLVVKLIRRYSYFFWGRQLINDSSWKNSSPFTDPSSSRDECRLQKEPLKHTALRDRATQRPKCVWLGVCFPVKIRTQMDGFQTLSWFVVKTKTENNKLLCF